MKGYKLYWVIIFLCVINIALTVFQKAYPSIQTVPPTPNTNLALEARVTVLEGQVKELRRVVGIEGGLKEGLQNKGKKPAPAPPKK